MTVAKVRLQIEPDKFWKLTFAEYWPLHEVIFGDEKEAPKKMSGDDLKDLQNRWLSGNKIRRVSPKSSRRNPRS